MHIPRILPPIFRTTLQSALAGAAFAVLGLACAATAQETIPRGESFFDDFDSFNGELWGISDGWANGEWQNCLWSKEAVVISRGYLRLRFIEQENEKRDYICGEVQSRHVYGYGTYEARIRAQRGSGLNAAFFTYIGQHHGQPHDEIDFEILTRDTSAVSLNTYVDGEPNNGKRVDLPVDADDAFITYSFVWAEDGITWYVDGVEKHRTAPGSPLPSHAQKIYASLWGSNSFPNWMGPFRKPKSRKSMIIDWIAFTAEGESCQFPGSLVCTLE